MAVRAGLTRRSKTSNPTTLSKGTVVVGTVVACRATVYRVPPPVMTPLSNEAPRAYTTIEPSRMCALNGASTSVDPVGTAMRNPLVVVETTHPTTTHTTSTDH